MSIFDDINMEEYVDLLYLNNINLKYDLTLKGNYLIETERYSEAIDFYSQLLYHELFINDYHPFLKLTKVYHDLEMYDDELKVISDFFNSGRYCRKSTLNWFKKKLRVLNKLGYLSNGEINELEQKYTDNGRKNRKLSNIPVPLAVDIKRDRRNRNKKKIIMEYNPEIFNDVTEFDQNSSIRNKIKFKYHLINKGQEFIENKQYERAFAYYTRLLTHELFVNDYHPYRKLCRICNKLKLRDVEVKIIIKFFYSGIYCNKRQLKWFEDRLKRLSKYGHFNISKMDNLKSKFLENGALNENLANTPVPISIIIKRSFEMLGSVSEEEILESIIHQIPTFDEDGIENSENEIHAQKNDLNTTKDEIDVLEMVEESIDLKERQQMIIVLKAIEEGKSMTQAALIAGCPGRKIMRWINNGKNNKNENTTYFFKELAKINEKKQEKINNAPNFKPVIPTVVDRSPPVKKNKSKKSEVKEVKEFNVNAVDDEVKNLIDKFNDYLKNPFYKMDIREFNLTPTELESVKNNIINDIIQKEITDDNFKIVLRNYCKKYQDNKNKLDVDDFNVIFDNINMHNYDESIIGECKSKTIEDYNSNKINKNGIESRFNYYYKRKIREKEQLNELNQIQRSSKPLIRIYLTQKEQNVIFEKIEGVICSEQGLNRNILEVVTNRMNRKVERNKSDARKQLASFRFNRKNFMEITNLKTNQIEGFTKQMEYYIDKNKIKSEDITQENLQKLSSNYVSYGGIFEGAENGI